MSKGDDAVIRFIKERFGVPDLDPLELEKEILKTADFYNLSPDTLRESMAWDIAESGVDSSYSWSSSVDAIQRVRELDESVIYFRGSNPVTFVVMLANFLKNELEGTTDIPDYEISEEMDKMISDAEFFKKVMGKGILAYKRDEKE